MIRVRSFLEIRRIATIVEQYARDHEVDEHDRVFVERLRVNRGAFSFEHWRGHFELEGVLSYPELKGHLPTSGAAAGTSMSCSRSAAAACTAWT